MGHFWPILGAKITSKSKFEESGQKFFSLQVFKNYFSQVYGHEFCQKCHKWGKFGQNRSFLVKIVKIVSFWGQNDATDKNLGKLVK